jgi:hypothetical protein
MINKLIDGGYYYIWDDAPMIVISKSAIGDVDPYLCQIYEITSKRYRTVSSIDLHSFLTNFISQPKKQLKKKDLEEIQGVIKKLEKAIELAREKERRRKQL